MNFKGEVFQDVMKKIMFPVVIVMILLVFQPVRLMAEEDNQLKNRQPVDKVAAVVGNHIILLSDVREKINLLMMARNMDSKTPSNKLQSLLQETLRDMINERLLLVKATQDSIEVDKREVDRLEKENITNLKTQFGSDEAFNNALKDAGLTEQQLRYTFRQNAYNTLLIEMLVSRIESYITPTAREMEAWVAANKDSLGEIPEQFKISHILLYAKVSENRKSEIKEKLQGILNRIRDGEDFAELAREYSEDPGSADQGGDIGDYFTRDTMFREFSDAAFTLNVGEVSDIVETPSGFHIIKVDDIRGERIKASHILLFLKPNADDEAICINKLKQIHEDILSGKAAFEDMAKEHSEDESSSSLGGKLKWLTREEGPNQGIPSFIDQAEKLEISKISEPFKSRFGYHILRLDDHNPAHTINIKDDNYLIRQQVILQKKMTEIERILEKLREETYFTINLD